MSRHPRFAQWLATAMRTAGLDIDKQRGGGRAELAERLNVSRSTITRWLEGGSLPGPEYIEPLAEALNVYVDDMLISGGIVSPGRMTPAGAEQAARNGGIYDSGVELPADLDLTKLAELLGYLPEEQEIFVAVVETTMAALRERRIRAIAPPFEVTVAESDSFRQSGASPTMQIDEPTTEDYPH
jgi:transcriptional regulator with XRE-family HTH domain